MWKPMKGLDRRETEWKLDTVVFKSVQANLGEYGNLFGSVCVQSQLSMRYICRMATWSRCMSDRRFLPWFEWVFSLLFSTFLFDSQNSTKTRTDRSGMHSHCAFVGYPTLVYQTTSSADRHASTSALEEESCDPSFVTNFIQNPVSCMQAVWKVLQKFRNSKQNSRHCSICMEIRNFKGV